MFRRKTFALVTVDILVKIRVLTDDTRKYKPLLGGFWASTVRPIIMYLNSADNNFLRNEFKHIEKIFFVEENLP